MTQEKIIGKTYLLYGEQNTSDYFSKELSKVTDPILQKVKSQSHFVEFLRKKPSLKEG